MAKPTSKTKAKASGVGDRVDENGSSLVQNWLLGVILIVSVLLAYQPAWSAEFIWDDDAHVTANPCIIGPLGLKEIWTTSAAWYYPLASTVFWIEHALWGLDPLPYHLVNIVLQGGCTLVLWRVLISLQVQGAWLGAALWALHPVQVESVAWVTELKNTLSGLFYLLAILVFVRSCKSRKETPEERFRWTDGLVLFFSFLAMASKSSTVVLPLVLCLCAWWIEGRWSWRNLIRAGPIFLMSVIASVATVWSVRLNAVHDQSEQARTLLERLITAGDIFWYYLGKLVWPSPLIFIYPRWEIASNQWTSYLPLLAAILVLALLWVYRTTWGRPYFFALVYFVAALLPVLGLVNQYFWRYSFVGDHFQYLASMGPLALAGAGVARLSESILLFRPWLGRAVCAIFLLIFGTLSWRQAWVYQSNETLWIDTLAKNPHCNLAYNNLGNIYSRTGKVAQAIALFEAGIKANPHDADLHNSLGNAWMKQDNGDEAAEEFHRALEIDPANFGAYNNLGILFAQRGQTNDAIVQYEQALQINPRYADAHNNLGSVLFQNGQADEAMAQFHQALQINANHVDAHNNLGWALLQKGRNEEAIEQFNLALRLDPTYVKSLNNLGIALAQTGHLNEAITRFREALRINPDDVNAQNNLAKALDLSRQGTPSK